MHLLKHSGRDMYEPARRARERIVTREVRRLERRQALQRLQAANPQSGAHAVAPQR